MPVLFFLPLLIPLSLPATAGLTSQKTNQPATDSLTTHTFAVI